MAQLKHLYFLGGSKAWVGEMRQQIAMCYDMGSGRLVTRVGREARYLCGLRSAVWLCGVVCDER